MAVEYGRRRSDSVRWRTGPSDAHAGPRQDDAIDLWSLGRRVWGFRVRIITGTIAFGAIVWLLALLVPHTYEAVAVVLVEGPPNVRVEPFQQVAKSDEIVRRVGGIVAADGSREMVDAADLAVVLYPSRESSSAYAPWIGLSVRSNNPQTSQIVANAWASALVEQQADTAVATEAATAAARVEQAEIARTEKDLLAVQERHAVELQRLETEHNTTIKSAELDARYVRIVALEDELGTERLLATAGRENVAEARNRERAIATQLQQHRALAASLAGALDAARRSREALLRTQSIELRKYQRALGDAIERHRKATLESERRVVLKIGSLAAMPAGLRERSLRAAVISLPFGMLLCLALAFVAAIGFEQQRAPRDHQFAS